MLRRKWYNRSKTRLLRKAKGPFSSDPDCNVSVFWRQEGAAVAPSSVLFWGHHPEAARLSWKIGCKEQKVFCPQSLLVFTLHNVELCVCFVVGARLIGVC